MEQSYRTKSYPKKMNHQNKPNGHLHPITELTQHIYKYFEPFGFEIFINGLEIVTTEDNFDSLNIPAEHSARREMDTFYMKEGDKMTLRTHMTSMYLAEFRRQIKKQGTDNFSARLLFPGRAFRNEALDQTHHYIFHQIDAVVIDKETNLANLVAMLQGLFRNLLGDDIEFRVRASHFPFTEPSIEFDLRRGNGKWLEMLGAGMVNPKVIEYYGLDPQVYQGLAFGIGLERVINVKCGVNDIRYNLANDYRYLGQF